MSTYSEAMVHLESDTDEVEINSGNSVDTAGDPEDIEFNIGNDMSSQQGKENSNDYKCISDLTDDDIRGMKFSTEIEATKFYELYAHLHGFAVRKDDVQRDCENRIVMRQLLCNKGTSDGSSRQTMRTGCQAKLRLRYDIVHKNVSVFNPTHNHELTPELTGKDDASVNPNIAINTDNSNMSRDFGQSARWTHDVRYDVNYFPMHSGIPNNGGYTFPQFSPGGILSSHPNTALHVGTQSVPNYTPHFFPQFSPGGIHSSHSNIVLHSGTQSAHSYTPVVSVKSGVVLKSIEEPI
ncbi:hypothetical protein TSUD_319320 [Trifolium subterraneum]|uniref:FAR1 domain-containing protein n=1 Tax=Trifolium subterraneum TaxID=3900 RepID=A0A2Z6MM29_TRISU|nr:hypothetical protein TSUD_319320 [Trifolium subterraneum]